MRWQVPLVAVGALALIAPRFMPDKKDAERSRISIYRLAPGKHLEFLQWQAARDEAFKDAGIPLGKVYAHLDGDSWDYLMIGPATTPEQDKKFDEAAAKRGLKTGFAASLEFREYLAWHSDTFVVGPMTAAELVASAK
jgi:hypothetical protein